MTVHYQIAKVLKQIEAHLTEEILLEDLAETANYSVWHFHRIFTSHTGYTVADYIRRRRLSEASSELILSAKPIREIAHRYGFESQEAFTRALKLYCGVTPGILRKQKKPYFRFSPIYYHQYAKHFRQGDTMLTPRFEHKEAFTVIGIAGKFQMGSTMNEIPKLWDVFNQREKEVKHALTDACYGVCFYDKDYDESETKQFTYMPCMIVSEVSSIPEGMQMRQIPACDYAVFEHHGSLETLGKTYDGIFREWFPTSEYEFASQDDFERYDDRFEFGKPESIMEIWIPVKKKQ